MKQTLLTARLVLNKHQISDLAASHALWNDTSTLAALQTAPRSRPEVWTKLLYHRGHWDHYGYGCYTVRDKQGLFLGEIGLKHYMRDVHPPGFYSDAVPEAGWVMHSSCQGQGYASEALRAIFDEVDRTLEVDTCCMITRDNVASQSVARRFGYELRGEVKLGDKQVDYFVRPRNKQRPTKTDVALS